MKKLFLLGISISVLSFLSSCEDNLNTPVVNSWVKSNDKVLLELFSSNTCVNCIQASIYCDNISFLKGVTVNDTNILIINYHPSFFPADPFYQFNRELNYERQKFYDIKFVPAGFSDGLDLTSPYSAEQWTNRLNTNLAEFNDVILHLENEIDTAGRTGKIIIQATPVKEISFKNLKLYMIITEGNLYFNSPNGKNYHHNIARQMLNLPGGDNIQITLGQPVNIEKNYCINQGINIQEAKIIVFIQENESRNILAVEGIKF